MKSVFKSVAPMALAITVAMSGVAMAETAAPVSKSADTTTAQPAKPVEHHHNLKDVSKETAASTAAASATPTAAATTATTVASADKAVPAADVKKAVEVKRIVVPIKTEAAKIEPSKAEAAKTK